MGRPREYQDRISTQIRLPVDLHERLIEAAEDRDVSINLLVTKAIADFLPRLVSVDELLVTDDR